MCSLQKNSLCCGSFWPPYCGVIDITVVDAVYLRLSSISLHFQSGCGCITTECELCEQRCQDLIIMKSHYCVILNIIIAVETFISKFILLTLFSRTWNLIINTHSILCNKICSALDKKCVYLIS